jgi:hypothetical protein
MKATYLTPKLLEHEKKVDLANFSPRERTNIRLYGLACKDWTPIMLHEYKRKWKANAVSVKVRPGQLIEATAWCRFNLFHQDFVVTKYAFPDDSHAIYFKNPDDAMIFKLSL